MCCEDVKMGRASRSAQVTKEIGATSTPFIPGNPDRFALLIENPPSGTLTVSLESTAVSGEGITFSAAHFPLVLNIKDHGDLVRRPWSAIHSVGGVRCTYIETTLTELCK